MSDCSVCLDFDVQMDIEFFQDEIRRTRKPYQCCECGDPINLGENYEYARGKCDGVLWDSRTCLACADVRNSLACGGQRLYGGGLWEAIEDILPDVTTACLGKLQTEAGRNKLRAAWRKWKGLTE